MVTRLQRTDPETLMLYYSTAASLLHHRREAALAELLVNSC